MERNKGIEKRKGTAKLIRRDLPFRSRSWDGVRRGMRVMVSRKDVKMPYEREGPIIMSAVDKGEGKETTEAIGGKGFGRRRERKVG